MTTCGMYDYAGEWVYRVGLPAKSGVAGGILAVLPGQLAIGVFSPPLDERGNSVRGVAVCEALSEELGPALPARAARGDLGGALALRRLQALGSKRARRESERVALAAFGGEAVVYQLQGDLAFAGMEAVVRRIVGEPAEVTRFVLDFARVTRRRPAVGAPPDRALPVARASAAARWASSGLARHPRLLRLLDEARARETLGAARGLRRSRRRASSGARTLILARARRASSSVDDELSLDKHELLRGLDAEQLELLASLMERRSFAARETGGAQGRPRRRAVPGRAAAASRCVSESPDGRQRRLATLSPGVGFGEPSIVEGAVRTASCAPTARPCAGC